MARKRFSDRKRRPDDRLEADLCRIALGYIRKTACCEGRRYGNAQPYRTLAVFLPLKLARAMKMTRAFLFQDQSQALMPMTKRVSSTRSPRARA